jgi:AraC-like DNA-binding protein
MHRNVVVIDPERSLPASFPADAALQGVDARVENDPHAVTRACDARVIVLVARGGTAREQARDSGLLAAIDRRRGQRLVLVVSEVRRQRRVVIQAARHGATVLIDQAPSLLMACLRDLLVPPRLPAAARQAFATAMAGISLEARSLLLLAADRAHPSFRSRQLAEALNMSRRTLTRYVRTTELRSVRELVDWGRLVRIATVTTSSDPLATRAREGGFLNTRTFVRTARRLLESTGETSGPVALDAIAKALATPDREHDQLTASPRSLHLVPMRGTVSPRRRLSVLAHES